MYSPETGRFQTRDTWNGDTNRPISQNRWLYASGNPVNRLDPTGHYDRQAAVQWAMAHDLMDPFSEGANYRKVKEENGVTYLSTDCAAFASSVISRGGVSDIRGEPPYEVQEWFPGVKTKLYSDYPISYWNREWAEAPHDVESNKRFGISYTSWMRVQNLYKFLTDEKGFSSFSVSSSNLAAELQNRTFDVGDLVFYGPQGGFDHVAVISSRWAPQTFFGRFTPLSVAIEKDWTTSWALYIVLQFSICLERANHRAL